MAFGGEEVRCSGWGGELVLGCPCVYFGGGNEGLS